MNGRKPTEARNLSINALKSAGCVEHTLPGISIIACHIIVCMVTCNDHQRTKDYFLVSCIFELFDYCFTSSIFRFAFYGSDKYILITKTLHLCLHLRIADLCCV